MILVDVIVPATGRKYDFELEETAPVKVIIREMLEIVCQREHRSFSKKTVDLCLYSVAKEKRLLPERTLNQCGIRSGEELILV